MNHCAIGSESRYSRKARSLIGWIVLAELLQFLAPQKILNGARIDLCFGSSIKIGTKQPVVFMRFSHVVDFPGIFDALCLGQGCQRAFLPVCCGVQSQKPVRCGCGIVENFLSWITAFQSRERLKTDSFIWCFERSIGVQKQGALGFGVRLDKSICGHQGCVRNITAANIGSQAMSSSLHIR